MVKGQIGTSDGRSKYRVSVMNCGANAPYGRMLQDSGSASRCPSDDFIVKLI